MHILDTTAAEGSKVTASAALNRPLSLQLLRTTAGERAGKTITLVGQRYSIQSYDKRLKYFEPLPLEDCPTTDDFFRAIRTAAADPTLFMVHGRVRPEHVSARVIRRTKNPIDLKGRSQLQYLQAEPVTLVMRDFDVSGPSAAYARHLGLDIFRSALDAVRAILERFAPELLGVRLLIQLSSSAGIGANGELDGSIVKFHAYHRLSQPVFPRTLELDELARREADYDSGLAIKARNGHLKGPRDPAIFRETQPNYIASPQFVGCSDLLPQRWFELPGAEALDFKPLVPADMPRHQRPVPKRAKKNETAAARTAREACNEAERQRYEAALAAERAAAKSGNARHSWPREWTWEQCLERLGHESDGSHSDARRGHRIPLYVAAQRCMDANAASLSLDDEAAREMRLAVFAEAFTTALDAAPTTKAAHAIAETKASIVGLLRAALAIRRREARVMPPYDLDPGLPADQARAATAAAVAAHFDDAEAFHQLWANARRSGHGFLNALAAHRDDIVAAGMGTGKTYALTDELARRELGRYQRYFIFADTIELLQGTKRQYDGALVRHNIKLPPAVILEGMDRLCAAKQPGAENDPALFAIRKRLDAVTSAQHSALEMVCAVCPFAPTCRYPAQFEQAQKHPGVYLSASAYLTSRSFSPAPPRDWNALAHFTDTTPPVYGAAIDEAVWRRQMRGVGDGDSRRMAAAELAPRLGVEKLSTRGFYRQRSPCDDPQHLVPIVETLHKWVMGIMTWETAKTLGMLDAVSFTSEGPQRWIDEAYRAITDHAENVLHRGSVKSDLAGELVRGTLRDGAIYAARDRMRFMADLLNVLRRQSPSTGPVNGVARCELQERGRNIIGVMLRWLEPLPWWLYQLPLLVLDGSMDPALAAITFRTNGDAALGWLEPELPGECLASRLRYKRIKAAAPEAYRVKIIGAPVSMRQLRDPLVDEKGNPRLGRRERDTAIEQVHRVCRAIGDRAGALGIVTYLECADYLRRVLPLGLDEGEAAGKASYSLMHFGAERGRNDFAALPAVIVAGRQLPDVRAIEAEAEALATMSPAAVLLVRTGAIAMERRGLRLSNGQGLAVDVPAHADPFVKRVMDHKVNDSQEQAIGRDRGTDPARVRPVLTLDFSDTCPDVTYDAVITWAAFCDVDEFDALLHGLGVLPVKPSELWRCSQGLWSSENALLLQLKRTAKNRVTDVYKRYSYLSDPSFCLPDATRATPPRRPFVFSPTTVLHGKPVLHYLLRPPAPHRQRATLQAARHRTTNEVLVDAQRPGALDAYAERLGKRLAPSDPDEPPQYLFVPNELSEADSRERRLDLARYRAATNRPLPGDENVLYPRGWRDWGAPGGFLPACRLPALEPAPFFD